MNATLKHVLITAGTTTVLLAGVGTLAAWRGYHHMHDPAEVAAFVTNRVDDALDDLDATPDQRTRIHDVKDRMLASAQKIHQDGDATRQAFLDAWKSPTPDRARLHALVDERADAFRALAHEAVDAGIDVHDTLTVDQRDKVTRKIERHLEH